MGRCLEQLVQDTNTDTSARPVIGARELRSYAGALSFVAGLVPHVRPFLASLDNESLWPASIASALS